MTKKYAHLDLAHVLSSSAKEAKTPNEDVRVAHEPHGFNGVA